LSSYYSPEDEDWIGVETSKNLIGEHEWYHLTFIRDTASQKIVQIIHQNASDRTKLPEQKADSLEQTHYTEYDYREMGFTGATLSSDQPLFLGLSPKNDTTWTEFHGRIDELRISNIARYENTITSIDSDKRSLPSSISLKQNYPNPFNPSTNIRFTLPQVEQVTINVYNSIGQKIETLVSRQMAAGSHSVTFDAEGLPSGVYIYRLKAGEYRESRKMLLVK